jgi:hypothetical protein
MDEIEINIELKKINALHSSLDESNCMTYIIFLESNRPRLNEAQIAWLDNKIDDLNEKTRLAFEKSMENIDVELATKPLTEKFQDHGELSSL